MTTSDGATRRICFVTGTRAEFGLMRSTLRAIADHSRLRLQIIATGMHLDPGRGNSINSIIEDGWRVDRIVPWDAAGSTTRVGVARCTGSAMAGLATALEELRSDVVLVVGDRVEAFAAAAAAHLSGRVVAHIHGGDRAAGQVDDALRHAISKLAHVHFPATAASAERLLRLGESRWHIRRVGSPGIDGIVREAAARREVVRAIGPLDRRRYALLVLHPADTDDRVEQRRAAAVARAVAAVPFAQIVAIYPNNDPGSSGIVKTWEELAAKPSNVASGRFVFRADAARPLFLGLLRDAAVLVGNSSAGIIEAASFCVPVVDIGPRQQGRERGTNVVNVPYEGPALKSALARIWNDGRPRTGRGVNIYGSGGAGRRIAGALANLEIDARLLRKLISY